jgi:hypothetical protein
VAGYAALGLDHRVLKNKWAGSLGMALGADGILIGSGLQLLAVEGAMRIMAVAASHKSFIHFVVEWLSESRPYVRVAGVAKLGLLHFEKIGFAFEGMRAMTIRAAYVGVAMRRALEVRVRTGVAGQTARVNLLRGSVLKDKNLGFVTASSHVLCAGSVAALAALMRGSALGIEHCFPVRRLFPAVVRGLRDKSCMSPSRRTWKLRVRTHWPQVCFAIEHSSPPPAAELGSERGRARQKDKRKET